MIEFEIKPIDKSLNEELQKKIDQKTKPLGSLGVLERVALQIGAIQNTLTPSLRKPTIVIFAGDHGIALEGVSPFPQEVTYQMVYNFLQGGAGINVFARQNAIDIKVVDAGVNYDFGQHPNLIDAKIGHGTKNFSKEPAMSEDQCWKAIEKGASIVEKLHGEGCNIIGFGEMGIANTSSASIIMSLLCNIAIENCIGRGTGLDDAGLQKKKEILTSSITRFNGFDPTPINVLKTFGGFEITMMCGAMMKAAELGMVVLVDGFIATSALIAAVKINSHVIDYCVFGHQSDEKGHRLMLEYLKAEPLLNLNMRLGEGTGAAVAYPIICSAVNFLNEMASFESAGISKN